MQNFKKNTPLPEFIPLPKFILESKVSLNAKFLYVLILNRGRLSQRNNYLDEKGNVYVIYPLEQMSKDLRRSVKSVTVMLDELEKEALIKRERKGQGKANFIYPLLPDDEKNYSKNLCKNFSGDLNNSSNDHCNNYTQDVKETSVQEVKYFHTSDKEYSETDINKTELKENTPTPHARAYGKFKNVFLTEEEFAELEGKISGFPKYLDRFSEKIQDKGYEYKSHRDAILSWWEEDKNKPHIKKLTEGKSEKPASKPNGEFTYIPKTYDLDEMFQDALDRANREYEKLFS